MSVESELERVNAEIGARMDAMIARIDSGQPVSAEEFVQVSELIITRMTMRFESRIAALEAKLPEGDNR